MVSGETLEEEKRGHGDASWRAANNLPLQFKGKINQLQCFFVFLTFFVLQERWRFLLPAPSCTAASSSSGCSPSFSQSVRAPKSRSLLLLMWPTPPVSTKSGNAMLLLRRLICLLCFFFVAQSFVSNSTDLAWSASDLAQHKSKVGFGFLSLLFCSHRFLG